MPIPENFRFTPLGGVINVDRIERCAVEFRSLHTDYEAVAYLISGDRVPLDIASRAHLASDIIYDFLNGPEE